MAYQVLIVDDQKDVSRLLRSALETIEKGLKVWEAPSGEEAILEASLTKIDLLIADFRLPGITGVQLMNKIRMRSPEMKVMIISGVSEPRLLREIEEAKPDVFLPKPVQMSDFLAAVERCLGMTQTIVNTTQAIQAQTAAPVIESRKGLGDLLVNLRKDLSAQAVLLLNGMGQVVAEAGQLPDPNNAAPLIASLMSMFNAAQKVAGLIDHGANHLHLFNNENLDGIFLPVGPAHALFLAGKGMADAKSLAVRMDLLFTARIEILDALKTIGVVVEAEPPKPKQRSAIDEPFTRAENLPREFMDIFAQIGKTTDAANSFWDTAVEKGTTYAEPDKLTYEQASRLGLTPDSAHDK
jgi:DNA-binding NarL/FixJ family response regulator